MSRKRQTRADCPTSGREDHPVRTFCFRHSSGYVIPAHSHDWHQLIYATEGVMSVYTAHGTWVIPPHRAVWVPARVEHSIEMGGSVLMQTVYFSTSLSRAFPGGCSAVNVSPLLRELIIHAVMLGMLNRKIPAHSRLIGVLLDQIEMLPVMPLQLPMPRDVSPACGCLATRAQRVSGPAQNRFEKPPGAANARSNGSFWMRLA